MMANPLDDPFAQLARNLADLEEDALGIAELGRAIAHMIAARQQAAHERLRITVAASMAVAALLAILAATASGVSCVGILVTGLLAGVGAGAPGLFLLVHPALLDRAVAIIGRYRR